jgi:ribosomal protein S18 acetylase RimI-like enzyme
MINVQKAPADVAADSSVVNELATLVNRVYAVAEDGLWTPGTSRTTPAKIAQLIEAGEIAVAIAAERIVGVIQVRQLDTGEGEFGMLVADHEHRRQGVGRELVRFAERWSQGQGLATMQLELLVPRQWRHPAKEFLKAWYSRIGYRPVRTGQFEESYPDLAPHLATACDFVIYHKPLPAFERDLVPTRKRCGMEGFADELRPRRLGRRPTRDR